METRNFNVRMFFHNKFFANNDGSLFEEVAVNSQSILLWNQHFEEEGTKELG